LFSRCADALKAIGAEGEKMTPALVAALKHSDEWVRRTARRAIRDGAPKTKAAVPALVAALDGRPAEERVEVLDTLAAFGPLAEPVVTALTGQLSGKDATVRAAAAAALGKVGVKAKEAVPELCRRLEDDDGKVRVAAAAALGEVGPVTDAVVPALAKALKFQESVFSETSLAAAAALGKIGPAAKAAVPDLVAELKRSHPIWTHYYAKALGGIGPDAKDALPALRTLMEEKIDPKDNLVDSLRFNQAWAAFALVRLDRDADAQKFLIEALKGPRPDLAAGALGELGPLAKDAVPALTAAFREAKAKNDLWVADPLGQALKRIDPDAAKAAGVP
jgi:HEAT repeat protein